MSELGAGTNLQIGQTNAAEKHLLSPSLQVQKNKNVVIVIVVVVVVATISRPSESVLMLAVVL